jgi:hypothetical protein
VIPWHAYEKTVWSNKYRFEQWRLKWMKITQNTRKLNTLRYISENSDFYWRLPCLFHCTEKLNNSMEQIPSWETTSHSPRQEVSLYYISVCKKWLWRVNVSSSEKSGNASRITIATHNTSGRTHTDHFPIARTSSPKDLVLLLSHLG